MINLPEKIMCRPAHERMTLMRKLEKNKIITTEIRKRIKLLGLLGKIDVFPVENVCTRRPRFWLTSDGTGIFKILMWDLNDLDDNSLSKEIDNRIAEARRYFGI